MLRLVTALCVIFTAFPAYAGDDCQIDENIQKAVFENPLRTKDDSSRDLHRRPDKVLYFAGIKPGDKVIDLASGTGYYSKILSQYVGTDGQVFAVNSPFMGQKFPDRIAQMDALAQSQENITHTQARFDEMGLPANVDSVFFINFYHDVLWLEYDRAKMNAAIFNALKPGGTYLIIDHEAPWKTGFTVGQTLHRMESRALLKEVLEAGFVLKKSGDFLMREDDILTQSAVKEEERRNKTSRFVYLFQKPKA